MEMLVDRFGDRIWQRSEGEEPVPIYYNKATRLLPEWEPEPL